MKNRKKKRKGSKLGIIATASLRIAPAAAIIAGIGYWAWGTYIGDYKSLLEIEALNRFLNNDNERVEQEAEDYNPEIEEIVEIDNNEPEDNEMSAEPIIPAIDFPEIIPEVETERTSSELYDSGAFIPEVDWEKLNGTNELANAWIYIPGTKVNNPIVQCANNDYYLHHDIENNDSKAGTLFIDYRDNPLDSEMDELSDVTTIYGHNQKSGAMFGTIKNYKSQAFYDKWPYGVVVAENGDVYKLDFFAGIIVSGDSEENIYIPDFIDESEFKEFFDYIISNSTFESDCQIEYGDKIIALSTCSYEYNNARFVLFGRLTKQLLNEQEVGNTLGM